MTLCDKKNTRIVTHESIIGHMHVSAQASDAICVKSCKDGISKLANRNPSRVEASMARRSPSLKSWLPNIAPKVPL